MIIHRQKPQKNLVGQSEIFRRILPANIFKNAKREKEFANKKFQKSPPSLPILKSENLSRKISVPR
jgi:hypothetical protein